jgi:hypothetical protein
MPGLTKVEQLARGVEKDTCVATAPAPWETLPGVYHTPRGKTNPATEATARDLIKR